MKRKKEIEVDIEIKIAAEWWASQLTKIQDHDAGDLIINSLARWVSSTQERPTEKQIADFTSVLIHLLTETKAANPKCWDKKNPDFGGCSPGRILAVDYGPDAFLRAAAQTAGIEYGATLFPIKTVMHLGPGFVTVKVGWNGEREVLYKENLPKL